MYSQFMMHGQKNIKLTNFLIMTREFGSQSSSEK